MDLWPPIAVGTLANSSVAELVASAFRASATGTLALGEGRGQSRLFLRYGLPCGVSLFESGRTFGEFLVSEGHVDADAHARLVLEVERTRRRYGELAVEGGVVDRQVLGGLLNRFCQVEVAQLCLRRQGTYELRGWERPPDWTAPVRVDPFRAIVDALKAEALRERRQAIRAAIGERTLRASADVSDLARRLRFEPLERRLLATLGAARPFGEVGVGLIPPDEAEPLLCALVLIGAIEPLDEAPATERTGPFDPPPAAPAKPSAPIAAPLDVATYVRTTPLPFPARAPGKTDAGRAATEHDILEDIATTLEDVDDEPPRPLSLRDEPTGPQVDLGLIAAEEQAREARAADGPVPETTAPVGESGLAEGGEVVTNDEPFAFEDEAVLVDEEPVALEDEAVEVVDEPVELVDEPGGGPVEPDATEPVSEGPAGAVPAWGGAAGGAPAEAASAPVQPHGSRDDVRRRLLQRAMRTVGGPAFSREEEGKDSRRPTQLPTGFRVERLDPQLATEIQERLARRKDDHFARLDLARTATDEDVKDAFLRLAKRFHPDRIVAAGQVDLLPPARELFAEIKESYDVLCDPALRARHLTTLEAGSGRTIERTPEDAKTAYQKATVFLRKRDFKNAEAELILAVETDPKSEYLAELAWTLFSNPARREDAHDQVRDLVQRALKATPVHDRALVVAGFVARADGDHDRAERRFRQAFEQNPHNVDAAREVRHYERQKTPNKGGLLDRLRRK